MLQRAGSGRLEARDWGGEEGEGDVDDKLMACRETFGRRVGAGRGGGHATAGGRLAARVEVVWAGCDGVIRMTRMLAIKAEGNLDGEGRKGGAESASALR